MKVKKYITIKEIINVQIDEITLLSVEEAEEISRDILKLDKVWWLRSPGILDYFAAVVGGDGYVFDYGDGVDLKYGLRPALRVNVESSNLEIGDKFDIAGYTWTVVLDGIALCNDIVNEMAFREDWEADDANVYEQSDIKKWLDDWWSDSLERVERAERGD